MSSLETLPIPMDSTPPKQLTPINSPAVDRSAASLLAGPPILEPSHHHLPLDKMADFTASKLAPPPPSSPALSTGTSSSLPSSPIPATPPGSPPPAALEPADLPAAPLPISVPETDPQQQPADPALPPSPPQHQQIRPQGNPLFSPDALASPASVSPPVYSISAETLAAAVNHNYSSPLPAVSDLFPWLHGLHDQNVYQRTFFAQPSTAAPQTAPPGSFCGLLLIKVHLDDDSKGTLIGSCLPQEILALKPPLNLGPPLRRDAVQTCPAAFPPEEFAPSFLNLDPTEGISLRNFQLQITKWAPISNIVLYASDEAARPRLLPFATLFATAQKEARAAYPQLPPCNTYIVHDEMAHFMQVARHIVAVPPQGFPYNESEIRMRNWDSNFLAHEGIEMTMMSCASSIGDPQNGAVWLGNNADFEAHIQKVFSYLAQPDPKTIDFANWTMYVRCLTVAQIPSLSLLDQYIRETLSGDLGDHLGDHLESRKPGGDVPYPTPGWKGTIIDFPSSGWFDPAMDMLDENWFIIVSMCKLLYVRSKALHKGLPTTSLIFCHDGYTESSFLALCYLIYSTGVSAPEAWVALHKKYNRAFFTFGIDVCVISRIQNLLLKYSPAVPGSLYDENYGAVYDDGGGSLKLARSIPWASCLDPSPPADSILSQCIGQWPEDAAKLPDHHSWFAQFDGSFPSVILPHMYLGSLQHANNVKMLVTLGIKRVISVGEPLSWVDYNDLERSQTFYFDEEEEHQRDSNQGYQVVNAPYPGISKVLHVKDVQDNGMDSLTPFLSTCLDFLEEGCRLHEPTLVHCRVGVSRSATVCIAEVMKRLSVGLPRAYLFVRVRRLNVIIQPHLRFMFELAKWEEEHRKCGQGWLREVDWPILCREINIMNRAYIPDN